MDREIIEAREFVAGIAAYKDASSLYTPILARSLKTLAANGDEQNFRSAVDSYASLLKKEQGEISKDPLSFIEWICAGQDHGFTEVGYARLTGTKLAAGTTQQMFRKFYGNHFNGNLF